jgi:cytochrome P450/NADPH-cytochrome P450 reductase
VRSHSPHLYVEISQPATPRNLRGLIGAENSEDSKNALNALAASYADEILSKRLSVLDLLELHHDDKITFEAYCPDAHPPILDPFVSLMEPPARYIDVPGRLLQLPGQYQTRRQSAAGYPHVPPPHGAVDPRIMFCAGSGVAPMRGFIQERALQKKSGREVGNMLLFYGCRSPHEDYLPRRVISKTGSTRG